MEVSGQLYASTALLRAPGTHWIGGWVGPRAGLDTMARRKIPSLYRDSKSRSSSPSSSAIPLRYVFCSFHPISVTLFGRHFRGYVFGLYLRDFVMQYSWLHFSIPVPNHSNKTNDSQFFVLCVIRGRQRSLYLMRDEYYTKTNGDSNSPCSSPLLI
jgi:hypothetical protein